MKLPLTLTLLSLMLAGAPSALALNPCMKQCKVELKACKQKSQERGDEYDRQLISSTQATKRERRRAVRSFVNTLIEGCEGVDEDCRRDCRNGVKHDDAALPAGGLDPDVLYELNGPGSHGHLGS